MILMVSIVIGFSLLCAPAFKFDYPHVANYEYDVAYDNHDNFNDDYDYHYGSYLFKALRAFRRPHCMRSG